MFSTISIIDDQKIKNHLTIDDFYNIFNLLRDIQTIFSLKKILRTFNIIKIFVI